MIEKQEPKILIEEMKKTSEQSLAKDLIHEASNNQGKV